MKKARLIALGVLFVGLLVAVLIKVAGSDPHYLGKSARAWALDLNSPDPKLRAQAVTSLQKMGSTAVPSLVSMLNTTNKSLSDKTFFIVVPRLPPKTRRSMYESHFPVGPVIKRTLAIRALETIGPDAHAAIPALHKALADKENLVSSRAAQALGKIGKESVPILLPDLHNSDPVFRRQIIYALGLVGADAQEAVPALIEQLDDPDALVRTTTIDALSKIGAAATPVLVEALHDKNAAKRQSAAKAIATIHLKNGKVSEALIEVLQDSEPAVRRQAAESLGILSPGLPSVVTALIHALQDQNSEVRLEAIRGLGRAGKRAESASPALKESLKDPDESVRAAALAALTKITNTTSSTSPP
ncbi:MAG: repeat-containing protein [Pedosphaera sp.]|nr:repeat-containing protein [Pedosphaera sp.]